MRACPPDVVALTSAGDMLLPDQFVELLRAIASRNDAYRPVRPEFVWRRDGFDFASVTILAGRFLP